MHIYDTRAEMELSKGKNEVKKRQEEEKKKKQEVCGLLGELLHVQHTAV